MFLISLLTFGAALTVGSNAGAVVIDPPWSTLGAANFTTMQMWDFQDSPNPAQADPGAVIGDFAPILNGLIGGSNPQAIISGMFHSPGGTGQWFSNLGEGASMTFNVPNWIDDQPQKHLRINVDYSGNAPIVNVLGFLNPQSQAGVTNVFNSHVDTSATHFYEDWTIYPNVDWEQVILNIPAPANPMGFTGVDKVTIHTISVPEPSSLALGLIGFVGVACARRRRLGRQMA